MKLFSTKTTKHCYFGTPNITQKFKQSVTIWYRKNVFFIVKSSIENYRCQNGNEESKELLDLIHQKNCILREEICQRMQLLKC